MALRVICNLVEGYIGSKKCWTNEPTNHGNLTSFIIRYRLFCISLCYFGYSGYLGTMMQKRIHMHMPIQPMAHMTHPTNNPTVNLTVLMLFRMNLRRGFPIRATRMFTNRMNLSIRYFSLFSDLNVSWLVTSYQHICLTELCLIVVITQLCWSIVKFDQLVTQWFSHTPRQCCLV
jgi:hypothetical protein